MIHVSNKRPTSVEKGLDGTNMLLLHGFILYIIHVALSATLSSPGRCDSFMKLTKSLSLDQSLYSVREEQQLYLYNTLGGGRMPYILVKLGHSTCSLDRARF